MFLLKHKWRVICPVSTFVKKERHFPSYYYSPHPPTLPGFQELCHVVSHGIGSLDDMEASLDEFKLVPFSSALVTRVLCSCKVEAPARRLLRFFSWSAKHLDGTLEDVDFNHAIRVFAEKKDFMAIDYLVESLGKEGRAMESTTFSVVAETLVKLGRVDEALGIFKNLDKLRCPQDSTTVTAIVSALCSKGHAKRAEGVVHHHKDKISGVKPCIYRNLLYGWSMQENVKESRRILKEMKGAGIPPDLFCYNTFLKCVCKRNLKANPSSLVPEALNVMMEMRTYRIKPTSVSYNLLLSCLGKTRRVKESLQVLNTMRKSGCDPDWVSYYLVARVLYLTGRFGKGKQIVDMMIEEGLVPDRKFYYDLIGVLCGVERVKYALELFELMKKSLLGGYERVYDLLIPKLCKGGDFEKGRELWNEASAMGLTLRCSSSVLDPTITKVFRPARETEKQVNQVAVPQPGNKAGTTKRSGKGRGKKCGKYPKPKKKRQKGGSV